MVEGTASSSDVTSDAPREKVPVWKKLGYAVGSVPYSMVTGVIGFYFSIFLLEVVIMDPVLVLVVIFSGRLWDALSDPVLGYLISFTRTRFGRLRTWIAVCTVPAGLAYFLVWYVPPLDQQPQYVKFIYYIIFYFILLSLLTGVYVPYWSLNMHLTNDNKERDSVTFYRMIFELSGVAVGVLIFTAFYVGLVQFSVSEECHAGLRVPDPQTRAAYRGHGLTIALLLVICLLVTLVSVREQKEQIDKSKYVGLWRGLKETLGFKPFFYLLMLDFLTWMGFQFLQANVALYLKYSVGLEKQYPYVIASLLISSILCVFIWQFVLVKLGKKTTFLIGVAITLPAVILLLFVNYSPSLAYVIAIILGAGYSSSYFLPWSMLPDVIDESLLTNNVRREELFYAFFMFVSKLSNGLALGVSTAVYKIAGYDETLCDQPWAVGITLKLLMVVPPVFLLLLGLLFLHFYPITEETRERTKKLLAEKRSQSVSDTTPLEDATHTSDEENSSREAGDSKPLLHNHKDRTLPTPEHSF